MKIFLNLLVALCLYAGLSFAQQEEKSPSTPDTTQPIPQAESVPSQVETKIPQFPQNPFPFEDVRKETGGDDHFMRDFMQMLVTLGIIVAMIFLVTWLLKKMMNTRMQQMNTSSEIKILERRSLTPKSVIYILEIKGKGIIVAESTNGLIHLSDFNAQLTEEEKPSPFSQIMQKNDKGFKP